MSMNRYSSTKEKPVNKEYFDALDKAAAKHLVTLGVEKDWRDVYRRMQKRRRKNERSNST